MTPLTSLILPIIVSAVIVFIASSIIHMAPLWHKNVYPAPANADALLDAMRPLNIPPGDYLLPRPSSREEMKTPEFKQKVERGPVLMMTVMRRSSMSMGRPLSQWFIYCAVMSYFAATKADPKPVVWTKRA